MNNDSTAGHTTASGEFVDRAAGANATPVDSVSSARRRQFRFTGSGSEYFKIWIVNVFLTIVTLYIYSAWAKVRTKRYFYGNTLLDGHSFEYHANPKQLLLGRMIAFVLLIFFSAGQYLNIGGSLVIVGVIALLAPWAIWRSMRFNARMSSYRNVRFGFSGTLPPLYRYLLVYPFASLVIAVAIAFGFFSLPLGGILDSPPIIVILGFLVGYLFVPWIHRLLTTFKIDNHSYGTARFHSRLTTSSFYWIYVKTILWSLPVSAVAVAAVTGIANTQFDLSVLDESSGESTWMLILATAVLYIGSLLFGSVISGYFKARTRNYVYSFTNLRGSIGIESSVRARSLIWIGFSNLLLLIATLGLAYPWTKVRVSRYLAENTALYVPDTLGNFVDQEQERVSVLGEEIGDAFDMDVGIGI